MKTLIIEIANFTNKWKTRVTRTLDNMKKKEKMIENTKNKGKKRLNSRGSRLSKKKEQSKKSKLRNLSYFPEILFGIEEIAIWTINKGREKPKKSKKNSKIYFQKVQR